MVSVRGTVTKFGLTWLGGALALPVWALSFDLGPVSGRMDSIFTLGAAIRMEDRDPSLIAKSNLQPGLCSRTNRTSDPGAPTRSFTDAEPGDIGSTCNSPTDPSLNLAYVNAPGTFNINGDNGNLNFDQYDVVSAAAKLTSDMSMSWENFGLFVRGIWLFNDTYVGFDEFHPDTSLQPSRTAFPAYSEGQFGNSFELVDAYVSGSFEIGDRILSLKLGRQGVNWGESTVLLLNSVNTVNPPDQRYLRTPGFDLKELFQPVGMLTISTDLTLNLAVEAFYQYEWRPVIIDAPGTFFSGSDVLGGDPRGGQYAMLSFGKSPEDPVNAYSSQDNPQDPFGLASAGGRTIYRLPDREARDGGEFGFALKYFAENFNNGTELAFYFTNLHSRIPSVSMIAAQATCAGDATNQFELLSNCGAGQGDIGTLGLAEEPLPVDTAALFAEYVEDIQMYGLSFNTTIGDWAWSGELTYRPKMPVQVHTVDLIFAALQPAFPTNNISVGSPPEDPILGAPIPSDPTGNVPGTVLPSRRVAVPDYVMTRYRGQEVQPGQYIRGYEELGVGQFTTTFLKTFGGDNIIRASQILFLGEAGVTFVPDLPNLSEVQFQGAGTDTHASHGSDGTLNGLADSATIESGGDGDLRCVRQTYASIGGAEAEPCRQNPTAQDPDGFGDKIAYGIRILTFIRYQDFFAGINFEPLLAAFYDIGGVAPGLGQNFQEGATTGLLGLRFDYLSKYFWELRYTYLDGDTSGSRDRDNLSLTLRYEF